MNKRHTEAAERFAERRRREDAAPRLRNVVPSLVTLRLEVEERRAESKTADSRYLRHVVDTAPALFLLPCGDPACKDGGHDLTTAIISGLNSGATRFEVEAACAGEVGSGRCGRVIEVTALATYQ
jgi:hypothetical protein